MHERLWAGSARLIIPADGNIMVEFGYGWIIWLNFHGWISVLIFMVEFRCFERSPVSLNIRLLAVLCQTNGQSARVYRITCMITAVLSIYFSLLLLLIPHVRMLSFDNSCSGFHFYRWKRGGCSLRTITLLPSRKSERYTNHCIFHSSSHHLAGKANMMSTKLYF